MEWDSGGGTGILITSVLGIYCFSRLSFLFDMDVFLTSGYMALLASCSSCLSQSNATRHNGLLPSHGINFRKV